MSARNFITVLKRDDVPDDILRDPPAVSDEAQEQELTTEAAAKSPPPEVEPFQAFLQSGVLSSWTFVFPHRQHNARHRFLNFLRILTFRVPSWRRCTRLIASSISGKFNCVILHFVSQLFYSDSNVDSSTLNDALLSHNVFSAKCKRRFV